MQTITPGGSGPRRTFYSHNYTILQDAIDAAKGQRLVLDSSFTTAAPVTMHGSTYDDTAIEGTNVNGITITASQSMGAGLGVLDIRASNIRLSNFTIDGASKANTSGLCIGSIPGDGYFAKKGWISGLAIVNTTEDILRFRDQVNYWDVFNVRAVDGHSGYGIHLYSPASSVYDNGQLSFFGCYFSSPHEVLRRTAVAATYHRIRFFGGKFDDGHSGTYMIQTTDMHEVTFYGVNFEVAAASAPASGVIYLSGYGSGMYGCQVFGQTKSTVAVMLNVTYTPYTVIGLEVANFAAGSYGINGTGSQCFGAETTIGQSFVGTLVNCRGSLRNVVNNTQPTLTFNGEIVTWEDSDGGPSRYIVTRINGVDYKVAVA